MNTPGSVAYGWGALIVAAGVSFYYANKETKFRRKEQALKGTRPTEKLTWEEKIARSQPQSTSTSSSSTTDPAPGRTTLDTTTPGGKPSAAMNSAPTGVDTPKGAGGSTQER